MITEWTDWTGRRKSDPTMLEGAQGWHSSTMGGNSCSMPNNGPVLPSVPEPGLPWALTVLLG